MSVKDYLLHYGIRPSVQRLAIMEYLMVNKTHPSADTIFDSLHHQMPTLSKMTVYNTLNLLVYCGAVIALDVDKRQVRYDGNTMIHAHFICKHCGSIIDLPIDEQAIEKQFYISGGEHSIDNVQFICRGECKSCKDKNKQILT